MPRRRPRTHPTWLALFALAVGSPAFGQATPREWRAAASLAHAGRDFAGRDAALCRLAQQRRHADPSAAGFVRGLTPAEALDTYGEVVAEIARQSRMQPAELFASGVQELTFAIDSPRFRESHFAPDADARRLRGTLANSAASHPNSAAEARELALRLTRDWHAAGLRHPQAVALELIAGACAAVDPYTHYDLVPGATASSESGVAVVSPRPDAFEIRVSHFGESTPAQMAAALSEATRVGADAVTLDLRGNAGGSLDAAARCVQLLGGGSAGRTRFGELPTTNAGEGWSRPVVIRVDAGTASAAELVAATLQERGRAVVVGELTFGKGRVQAAPIPLSRGWLTVTVAELTTPGGVAIEGRGVTPDAAGAVSVVAAR